MGREDGNAFMAVYLSSEFVMFGNQCNSVDSSELTLLAQLWQRGQRLVFKTLEQKISNTHGQ